MGFSCEADKNKEECVVVEMNGEIRGSCDESSSGMEFWPLEHPIEPLDEDQPVKCPMLSESSATNLADHMSEDRSTEILRKRMESTVVMRSRELSVPGADSGSTVARPDRKRHHTLTHGDIVITPIMRTRLLPPPPPTSACKVAVFRRMFHPKDSFEP